MPITYSSDHDWEKHTTFDIDKIFGTNYKNDDVNNCNTISTIHVSSNDDIESSKLGEEVFENPFATDDYIFETSPSSSAFFDLRNGRFSKKSIFTDCSVLTDFCYYLHLPLQCLSFLVLSIKELLKDMRQ